MASITRAARARAEATTDCGDWRFTLYIAGPTDKSAAAIVNLRQLCEAHLAGHYAIEVIDLIERPELARSDQILVIPTLVRHLPEPTRKIVGDLSNHARTLMALQIRPAVLSREAANAA